jgi:hypothetical protein
MVYRFPLKSSLRESAIASQVMWSLFLFGIARKGVVLYGEDSMDGSKNQSS